MFQERIDHRDAAERCGLFVGARGISPVPAPPVSMVVELPNRAPTPNDNFVVAQVDVDSALRWLKLTQSDVYGFWHTHPPNTKHGPSQPDLDSVALGDKEWWHCVYVCETGGFYWYDYNETLIVDYNNFPVVPWKTVRLRK